MTTGWHFVQLLNVRIVTIDFLANESLPPLTEHRPPRDMSRTRWGPLPNIFEVVAQILYMETFDPAPPDDAVTKEQEVWTETTNTRNRIRTVVVGLYEPATVTTIADRAQCSANAARTHLEEFVTLGIVRKHDQSTGARYARNEAYVHWRRANDLAVSHSLEELLDELASLETTHDQFQEQFNASAPSDVDLPPEATHAEIEAQLKTLSEWATVREEIDRHKEAIRIARRTDDRLTA